MSKKRKTSFCFFRLIFFVYTCCILWNILLTFFSSGINVYYITIKYIIVKMDDFILHINGMHVQINWADSIWLYRIYKLYDWFATSYNNIFSRPTVYGCDLISWYPNHHRAKPRPNRIEYATGGTFLSTHLDVLKTIFIWEYYGLPYYWFFMANFRINQRQ